MKIATLEKIHEPLKKEAESRARQPAGRSIYRSRTAASGAPSGSHGHSRYGGGGDLQ